MSLEAIPTAVSLLLAISVATITWLIRRPLVEVTESIKELRTAVDELSKTLHAGLTDVAVHEARLERLEAEVERLRADDRLHARER